MPNFNQSISPQRFTLIELLIVVVILLILASMLLPLLERSRDKGLEVACAANLSQMGTAAMQFAGEHNRIFPRRLRTRSATATSISYIVLDGINYNEADAADDNWKIYGTTIGQFGDYGLTGESWMCPALGEWLNIPGWQRHPEYPEVWRIYSGYWGWRTRTQYLWLGGLDYAGVGAGTINWQSQNTPPNMMQDATDTSALAADEVNAWSNTVVGSNHPQYRDGYPSFQGVLRGDGHVDANRQADYSSRINWSNYSFDRNGNAHHWSWEGK